MNDNLVKMLREKTEEADLDTILKPTLGGYSRKSVQEYISMMRQQQYDMQQSFAEELQMSQTERDRLARELEETRARAGAAAEALEQAKPLMEKAAGLEKDMDEAVDRIREDEARMEQLRQELECVRSERDELRARLEEQEKADSAPMQETEQSSDEPAAREEPQEEIREESREEPTAESPETGSGEGVLDLFERPETMQVQLAILVREREKTEKRMENLLRQDKNLFQALQECRAELEERRDQNRWMEAENNELSRRLSEQTWQNVALNREITRVQAMNESLKNRLEEALEQPAKRGAQNAGDGLLWDFAE